MPSSKDRSVLVHDSSGPADAPTIVFLHGGGGAAWMWKSVVELLPEYHCMIPDLPEHGRNRDVKPFAMDFATDLVADMILNEAHGSQAHIVGLSEGAQVCVELLSLAPQRARSAIISSASLRPVPGAALMTPGVLAAMYYTSVAPLKGWDAWIRLNMKYAAGVPEQYFPEFKRNFQAITRNGWVNLMRANLAYRLPAGLERATVPALVVVGSKEYASMKQSARDLTAALPHARGYTVNLGTKASLAQEHNWALTAPHIFATMVRAWINGDILPTELSELT